MSSITPQSFVDDGGSFTKRVPRGLDQHHVAGWIANNGSDTSAYTGSFVDDGLDMHLPPGAAPGFGPIDTRFYKQKKRKELKDGAETAWNDDVQKAISGDIQRNLEKMRELGGLEVKKADDGNRQGETAGGQEEAKKDTVTIPMPPQWGTFIIKADDGRVIVVDKDGEFDSGPRKAVNERPKHWVKAASTVDPVFPAKGSVPPSQPKHCPSSRQIREHSEKSRKQKTDSEEKDKHKKSHHLQPSPPKILTPIAESEYEDGFLSSVGEDMGSLTGFMMTGGASGWPCSRATSVASPAVSVNDAYEYIGSRSPIKAISDGFRHVTPQSRGYKYVVLEPNSGVEEKKTSPVRSPPGGWPSPELSPVKGVGKAVSETSWDGGQFESAWKAASPSHSCKSDKSRGASRSIRLQNSKKDSDNVSMKSHVTYKAPTVKDAVNTSSEEKKDYIATGWGSSVKSSVTQDWGDVKKSFNRKREDKEPAWTSPPSIPHPHTWAGAGTKSPSEPDWSKRSKAADNPSWTGIDSFTFQQHANSPMDVHFGSPRCPSSDVTWDGFERNKSTSEVGVVDIGSERASLGHQSRVSSGQSTRPSHYTHSAHASHRSSTHAQPTGWEDGQIGWAGGSQTSHQSRCSHRADATAGWPGSRAVSEQSWSSQKAGVDDDKEKHANDFDEDNATYLNDNWGGIPVRVGSGAGSRSSRLSGAAVGWEQG